MRYWQKDNQLCEILHLCPVIFQNVFGFRKVQFCVHIALATIHKADILVSWNFKHIVNVYRIRGYNSVNLKSGYATIEIRSPKDIIGYEDEETD